MFLFLVLQWLIIFGVMLAQLYRFTHYFIDWTFLVKHIFSRISKKTISYAVFTVRLIFDSSNLFFRTYIFFFVAYLLIGYLLRMALLREFTVFYDYFLFFFAYFVISLFFSFWISFSIFTYKYLISENLLYFTGSDIPPIDIDVNQDNTVPPPTVAPKLNVSGTAWNGGNGPRIWQRLQMRGKWRLACDAIGICGIFANTALLYTNTKAIWAANAAAADANYHLADANLVKKRELGIITTEEYFTEKRNLDRTYRK